MLERERDEYLEEIYSLVKENNKLLRKERRARIYGSVVRLLWWSLAIGLPIWFYFNYVQPLIGSMQENLKVLEGLGRVNPQLGAQLDPIVQSVKTIMTMFGAGN